MGSVVQEIYLKWQKVDNKSNVNIDGANFQTAIELEAKAVAGGTYRIQWYLEATRNGNQNFDRKVRVRLANNVISEHVFTEDTQEPQSLSGWDIQDFGNRDAPVIDIQVATEGGNPAKVVGLKNLRIAIELMETE